MADYPHPLHPGLVYPVRIDPTGKAGPTKGQAAGPRWRWTSHGHYVSASVDQNNVEQRIIEAATLLPEYGGLTGWGALRWAGATLLDGSRSGKTLPVPLAIMRSEIRPQPGLLVTAERLPARDLTTYDGLPITIHPRSVAFEMRGAPSLAIAVAIFEMAARDDLVSIAELVAYVANLNGWTGVPQCREAIPLLDENVWSWMESFMKQIWIIDAGFPKPLCNQPVFDRNDRHIGTPDLLDVEAGVVGEYEGELHLNKFRRARDLEREAAYRQVGLEYFTMVSAHQASPITTIVPTMIEARGRALFQAESTRAWTVTPPSWWTSTTTVAARRALTANQRKRLLRYRAS